MPTIRQLSDVPPGRFVEARANLVRELRAAGKAAEAKAVEQLRKPSVALWIVNQLGRIAPEDVKALIDATKRLRTGGEVREAMRDQRDALNRLSQAAGQAAKQAEATWTLALQRRVQTTLQSAAAAEPDALREGTLEHELEAAGFEGLAGVAIAPPRHEPKPPPAPEKDLARERELRKAGQLAQRLAKSARQLDDKARQAEDAAAAARKKADDARREADRAAARVLELRKE